MFGAKISCVQHSSAGIMLLWAVSDVNDSVHLFDGVFWYQQREFQF